MSRIAARASLRARQTGAALLLLLAGASPLAAASAGPEVFRGPVVASNAVLSEPAPATPASSNPPAAEPAPGNPAAAPVPLILLPLAPAEVDLEVLRLRAAFAAEVPHPTHRTPASDRAWIARARAAIATSAVSLNRPQLIVVVDRNPAHQEICIVMARAEGAWEVIGGTRVSTGQVGRFDHYVTPTGVFPHTDAILDYRAEGTFNENHIRGLGLKGMRVWDFGWHPARKGWGANRDTTPIRFEMHATDPAVLEQRIGAPASQGCVRVPAAMNRFMDLHGVLDADYEVAAMTDIRYRALLLRDRKTSKLAGDTLVVVDSSEPLPH